MADIDSISESAPIDIEVMAPQGPRGPNSVTSATTSDGTADLSVSTLSATSRMSAGDAQNPGGKVTILSASDYPFEWVRGDDSEFFAILPPATAGQYFYTMPSRSGTLAIAPTGPYANDRIAAGSAYVEFQNFTFVWLTAGTAGNSKSIGMTQAVSPDLTPRVEISGDEITVYYAEGSSTYEDIIYLILYADCGVNASCPEYLYLQPLTGFSISPAPFTNGSATPHVSVGSLYYTADGSVKRRMA